ncbi:hypothetical protein [Thermoactinospora rubra]|uniref:hypothetical protein n=1 Tax=Thermoactinospora rubra TaxID=1088767 RepID=UPI000A11BBBB|nr:hypothetical protein [Thermoactinospora rubra]
MTSEQDRSDQEREERRERDRGTTFDAGLHNMGGDVGPASIRGSNLGPGQRAGDDAEPKSGYARPMGNVTGRDDEVPATAGSDEKAVAARTDEIDHADAAGPSPHPTPPQDREARRETQGEGGDPGFRVRGPVDEDRHGEIVEEGTAVTGASRPGTAGATGAGEHVSADVDWVPSDEDDPDAGSGRTDADDGGYLPGEGMGRPY